MRVLILATKYSLDPGSPSLMDELAIEMERSGNEVEVLLVDWSGTHRVASRVVFSPSLAVNVVPCAQLHVGPRSLRRAWRWMFSSLRASWSAFLLRRRFKPDVFVAGSPLTALVLVVLLLSRRKTRRRFLIQADFFPDAHVQDGAMPAWASQRLLRWLESTLMRRFTIIGCMSPKNIQYLKDQFDIRGRVDVVHLPLWSSCPSYCEEPRNLVRRKYGIHEDVPVFVFGGQLISGRGIEEILEAAEVVHREGVDFALLFVGRGPKAVDIEGFKSRTSVPIRILEGMPRSEYLQFISACDVGLVATLDVQVPTFPSKTLDYLQTGTTILASVANTTDYGGFLERFRVGVWVEAGRPDDLAAKMTELCRRFPEGMAERAARLAHYRRVLSRCFSVSAASQIVLGERAAPDWETLDEVGRQS